MGLFASVLKALNFGVEILPLALWGILCPLGACHHLYLSKVQSLKLLVLRFEFLANLYAVRIAPVYSNLLYPSSFEL